MCWPLHHSASTSPDTGSLVARPIRITSMVRLSSVAPVPDFRARNAPPIHEFQIETRLEVAHPPGFEPGSDGFGDRYVAGYTRDTVRKSAPTGSSV